jgi:hypothetical protein
VRIKNSESFSDNSVVVIPSTFRYHVSVQFVTRRNMDDQIPLLGLRLMGDRVLLFRTRWIETHPIRPSIHQRRRTINLQKPILIVFASSTQITASRVHHYPNHNPTRKLSAICARSILSRDRRPQVPVLSRYDPQWRMDPCRASIRKS